MKKLLTLALIGAAFIAQAQTTAVNWTATDCNTVSHTLFNELDAGKVIVFDWVMPCASCVNPSKTAYNVVQGYATSHPGQVLFYMADDLGDASCSTLTNWVNTNGIGNVANMTIFDNAGNVINENDFGGSGMPHIIVMAGTDHKIYFNKKASAANDATGIQNAINAALTSLGISEVNQISFSVSPNPVQKDLVINYAKPVKGIVVTSTNGQVVKEVKFENGKTNPTINLAELNAGYYVVKITDSDDKVGTQKILKN